MMKQKFVIIPIVATLALILVLACIIFIPMIKNNVILHNFAKQLYDLPLPDDTIVVTREEYAGQLGGNRSYLGFSAFMEVKTSLTTEELNAYYSEKTLKSVSEVTSFNLKPAQLYLYAERPENWETVQITVMQKRTATRTSGTKWPYSETLQHDDSIDEDLFIIQITDSPYNSGFCKDRRRTGECRFEH